MLSNRPADKPLPPLWDLQRFAGGKHLTCASCRYFQEQRCLLHQKRVDAQNEACSHYQAKQ